MGPDGNVKIQWSTRKEVKNSRGMSSFINECNLSETVLYVDIVYYSTCTPD